MFWGILLHHGYDFRDDIKRYVKQLASKVKPLKVVLFGTYAGKANEVT